VVVAPKNEVLSRVERALNNTKKLLGTYEQGRILREGLHVSLVGRPNVGKSSLLNALVKEDRAIVTEIAGTTRDTVEGRVRIAGVLVTFVDTAGLRETNDLVETIGVKRAREAATESDLIAYVVDLTSEFNEEVLFDFPVEKSFVVGNKADLIDCAAATVKQAEIQSLAGQRPVFLVSSKTGSGLLALEDFLKNQMSLRMSEDSDVAIQSRHFHLLEKLKKHLEAAQTLIASAASEEFIALELSDGLRCIHEVLGTEVNEQIIDRVFRDFCIGK
jgi:tRNA modification GTPase